MHLFLIINQTSFQRIRFMRRWYSIFILVNKNFNRPYYIISIDFSLNKLFKFWFTHWWIIRSWSILLLVNLWNIFRLKCQFIYWIHWTLCCLSLDSWHYFYFYLDIITLNCYSLLIIYTSSWLWALRCHLFRRISIDIYLFSLFLLIYTFFQSIF